MHAALRYYDHTTIRKVDDIPKEAHFAVLAESSFSYDDGYGERGQPSYSSHEQLDYIIFTDEPALHRWIIENNGKKRFQVISVKLASFEINTKVMLQP